MRHTMVPVPPPSLRWRVDVAAMGVKGPEHPDDEFQFYEPKKGIYKECRGA